MSWHLNDSLVLTWLNILNLIYSLKGFHSKNATRESHTCTFRKIKLKNWETVFHKCPTDKKSELVSWAMSIHKESFPHSQSMNVLIGLWLDFPLFGLFPQKYSPCQTLSRLTCSLLWLAFSKLQFLCYSQINSIAGNPSLPQFPSLFRMMPNIGSHLALMQTTHMMNGLWKNGKNGYNCPWIIVLDFCCVPVLYKHHWHWTKAGGALRPQAPRPF